MSALNDLIAQIDNPELRDRIQAEVARLNKQKKFGLVFEEHMPECTPLYDIPVKRGSLVARKNGNMSELFFVQNISDKLARCYNRSTKEIDEIAISDLVSGVNHFFRGIDITTL